jgi:hypothetical protein
MNPAGTTPLLETAAERAQLVDLLTRVADHWDTLNTDR